MCIEKERGERVERMRADRGSRWTDGKEGQIEKVKLSECGLIEIRNQMNISAVPDQKLPVIFSPVMSDR